jgi:hypothetical protein
MSMLCFKPKLLICSHRGLHDRLCCLCIHFDFILNLLTQYCGICKLHMIVYNATGTVWQILTAIYVKSSSTQMWLLYHYYSITTVNTLTGSFKLSLATCGKLLIKVLNNVSPRFQVTTQGMKIVQIELFFIP